MIRNRRTDVGEMKQLRGMGFSLQQIGYLKDISRERVRQLIGNTGRIALQRRKRREVKEEGPDCEPRSGRPE